MIGGQRSNKQPARRKKPVGLLPEAQKLPRQTTDAVAILDLAGLEEVLRGGINKQSATIEAILEAVKMLLAFISGADSW